MAARTGEQFLAGLRGDKRELWLGPERIEDATEHPALAGGARAIAAVFDVQHEFPDDCLMPDPETGEPINVSHMIPRCLDDLLRRRRGLERISAATVGMMGRTPDYMNVTFAGFAGRWKDWVGADGANARGADNLVQFQKRLARDDLSLTHTLVHPTVSRAKEMQILGNPVPMHKVGETDDSIVISGARILATLAPYSDELAVYPGFPLVEEGTGDYALSFSIPMDTPGLIFLCRDSTLTPDSDPFDRPMSTRFDEQDAFVIFDEVEVPKDLVFIDCERDVYNSVMAISWWPNIMQQTTVRALTKLEFAYALACRMADAVGDQSDITTDMLGELACYVEMTRNAIVASEQLCRDYGDGVVFPDDRALHPMRSLLTEWIPRALEIIMLIGSHNLLATPSRAMLDDERLRPLIDVYLDTANADGAEARAALFRLAWDFVGSGLGSRVELYERFYLGSRSRNRKMMHISSKETTGWQMGSAPEIRERGGRLVDGMLGVTRWTRWTRTDTTTASPREAAERLLKPIQQFTRGWMTTTATAARAVELGFPSGHEFWVVGRAGVLGECGPEVAAAGLAFIAPAAVRDAYEARPPGLSCERTAAEFSARCVAWGGEALAGFDPDRMAQLDHLGRRVIDAAPAALGSVFAGWRAMPRPDDVGGGVALTTHVLREMRGAAHIAAVIGAGITPLDAILASPAAPPRSGPDWAVHMGWQPPFRDAAEVRAARADAEDRTSAIMAAYLGVLDGAERGALVELVTTTRDSIEM